MAKRTKIQPGQPTIAQALGQQRAARREAPEQPATTEQDPILHRTEAGFARANEEREGVEVVFGGRPDRDVLDTLKSAGFRWHRAGRYWYAKANEQRIAAAKTALVMAEADAD
jgi:hypothetical protein